MMQAPPVPYDLALTDDIVQLDVDCDDLRMFGPPLEPNRVTDPKLVQRFRNMLRDVHENWTLHKGRFSLNSDIQISVFGSQDSNVVVIEYSFLGKYLLIRGFYNERPAEWYVKLSDDHRELCGLLCGFDDHEDGEDQRQ